MYLIRNANECQGANVLFLSDEELAVISELVQVEHETGAPGTGGWNQAIHNANQILNVENPNG